MGLVESILVSTMRMTTPFLLASLGLVVSERAGMMQVTAEGLMVLGAFAGYWGVTLLNGNILLAVVFAILVTMLMSLIFAVTTITLSCKQVIIGTAMNMLIPGLCTFMYRRLFVANTSELIRFDVMRPVAIPLLSKIPVLGPVLFNQTWFTYFGYVMIFVVWFVLRKTSLGIKIIAAGEHPKAAETTGIRVVRVRYMAVLYSAAMFAVAGAYLSLGQSGVYVENMAEGRGFIAMAIVIMGRWSPIGAFLGSLLFGFTNAIQITLQTMGVSIPSNIILMIPYVSTLLVVILFKKKNTAAPSALGVPLRDS